LPFAVDEGSPETIYAGIGDFWRAYEAHRTATMHDSGDATNVLTALTNIMLVHKEFMASLAAISPSVPAGQSTAAAGLIAGGGFAEA
jgi:hypothetical protein